MPAYLRSSVATFLTKSDSEINSTLATQNANQRFQLMPEALHAWNAQLPTLKEGLRKLVESRTEAASWQILLEYPIPQIGRRIDAVILAGDLVVVIETKTGLSPTSARRQAEDYAISLACFHEGSVKRTIVPLVVSDAPNVRSAEQSEFESLIRPCLACANDKLGETLLGIITSHPQTNDRIDPEAWDKARFRPVPSIIEAAVKLYSGMDVFEIGHAAAARGDLEKTTNAILTIVANTREQRKKAICFVTGVPGAGKTLVGLNAVHHTDLKDNSMFLSGNGPLVKIIREALIRDVIRREKKTRRSAETTLHAFVANVHRFVDANSQSDVEPVPNVIVFDEAQRAWDQEQNSRPSRSGNRSQRPDVSEPHLLLDIMNRRDDWAVVIALIGGGQEINRGEAGLSEWGRSLQSFESWNVYADSDVLAGNIRANGFQLFESPDAFPTRVNPDPNLHLRTNVRSVRAQGVSDWVDAVLSGHPDLALRLCESLTERPALTRSIQGARQWLRGRRIGLTRAGLVSSAHAIRLRADGLEPSYDFHRFYEWERWFLDRDGCEETDCTHQYCNDVRASSKLEVCATQFEIQGLELDWIGVCWGEDLVWSGKQWIGQKFNNKKWMPITIPRSEDRKRDVERKHLYRVNAYRVLLTRARQGMIIYVPNPPSTDSSRAHQALNASYDFMASCGALTVDR
jgi:hypothetical protein